MDASRKRSRAVAVVLVAVVHLGLISLLTRSLASNVHSSYRLAAPPIRSSLIVQPRSPLLAKPERLPTKPTLASIQVALQPAPAFHRRIPPEPVPSAGPTRHATGSPARRGGGRSAHRRRSPLLSMSRRSIRARPRADCCARSSWYFRASRTAGRVRPSPARRVAQGTLGGVGSTANPHVPGLSQSWCGGCRSRQVWHGIPIPALDGDMGSACHQAERRFIRLAGRGARRRQDRAHRGSRALNLPRAI